MKKALLLMAQFIVGLLLVFKILSLKSDWALLAGLLIFISLIYFTIKKLEKL